MLKRETQKQLMRDLIARGAMSNQHRASPLAVGGALLLVSISLYWLMQI